MGCHPLSVVTAITAQDTAGVAGVQPVDPGLGRPAGAAVLADMAVGAFKIGMLATRANAAAIAAVLDEHPASRWCSIPCLPRAAATRSGRRNVAGALAELLVPRSHGGHARTASRRAASRPRPTSARRR